MIADKMEQAETMRYAKIRRLINLLCPENEGDSDVILNDLIENDLCMSFDVGGRITVEGSNIMIKNIAYHFSEIQKIKINTEGSMWVYGPGGKCLCDWRNLNVSTNNVELFCLWARRYNVPAEEVSGKRERIVQWSVFSVGVLVYFLIWILKLLN